MNDPHLEIIETKLVYLEDTVEELNKIVYAQQQRIDHQQALIDSLVEHVRGLVEAAPERSAGQERPPHY